jgi:hypothetical protein
MIQAIEIVKEEDLPLCLRQRFGHLPDLRVQLPPFRSLLRSPFRGSSGKILRITRDEPPLFRPKIQCPISDDGKEPSLEPLPGPGSHLLQDPYHT